MVLSICSRGIGGLSSRRPTRKYSSCRFLYHGTPRHGLGRSLLSSDPFEPWKAGDHLTEKTDGLCRTPSHAQNRGLPGIGRGTGGMQSATHPEELRQPGPEETASRQREPHVEMRTWVGVPLAQGRKCAAGSQSVFFSPRPAGRFCATRRMSEPTCSPAQFPDPHL